MTKVMLVDDDASMQVLIEQIVRRGGYDFCCAGNGADGLEMLRAERPDFLILDVMLPDINGFEICEIIRGEGRDRRPEAFSVGDLEIRFGKYEVRMRGEVVALSSREIELLELLASDPGAVFTRDQILEALWGSKEAADPNSITVMVRKIREKIEENPSEPKYLLTVQRVGYKMADTLG